MMFSEEIENVLTAYLNNSKAKYAVMIDGDWGVGKTYFIKHSLQNIIGSIEHGKSKVRNYAYVSLYGVKSIEKITKEILLQAFGEKHEKKLKIIDTIVETTSNILSVSTESLDMDLSKIMDILSQINIDNWIVCFDDLERCCLPINEIFGYINQLVEHCECKVIIIANEREIGKLSLGQRTEEKYQVILSGQKLVVNTTDNTKDETNCIDVKELKARTEALFNDDIIYYSIREKIVGLTIKFEAQLNKNYDSIINGEGFSEDYLIYLQENKDKILNYFETEGCYNLRTLICVFSYLEKIYYEMKRNNYNTIEHYAQIMDLFLEYVVLLTIYYKKGGKLNDLRLTTDIGYVHLKSDIYGIVKGFKFLEKYCSTLSFSENEFKRVVAKLRKEYDDVEKKSIEKKIGLGKAYSELSNWWELEDKQVDNLINELYEEIKDDKYHITSYQGIIGQLLVLDNYGFNVNDIDLLVQYMNINISKITNIEEGIDRNSFAFDDPEIQDRYNNYIDKLKYNINNRSNNLKENEISQIFTDHNWANTLYEYCEIHNNDFLLRYGFIDLIDLEIIAQKLKIATTKEWYVIRNIFKMIYRPININEIYINDMIKLKQLKDLVLEIKIEGINKPLAQSALIREIDDIIRRLKQ